MRLRCSWPTLFGLLACLGLVGCSQSTTAEMPTKVVPRPANGLQTGQPTPAGGTPDASAGGAAQIAPDPGSP